MQTLLPSQPPYSLSVSALIDISCVVLKDMIVVEWGLVVHFRKRLNERPHCCNTNKIPQYKQVRSSIQYAGGCTMFFGTDLY